MTTPVKEKDTLEKIVEEAIKREQEINKAHPERHGYGMIEGEADDFIKRIELLEYKLERAQKEKVRTRKEKIRLIGRDRLYTRSPEDVYIEESINNAYDELEQRIRDSLPNRTKQVYDLNELGEKQKDIADKLGVSQPTVSRELKEAMDIFAEELEKNGSSDSI